MRINTKETVYKLNNLEIIFLEKWQILVEWGTDILPVSADSFAGYELSFIDFFYANKY